MRWFDFVFVGVINVLVIFLWTAVKLAMRGWRAASYQRHIIDVLLEAHELWMDQVEDGPVKDSLRESTSEMRLSILQKQLELGVRDRG